MQPIGTAAGLALMAMGYPQHGQRWDNDLEVVPYDDGKGKTALFWPTVICPDPLTALDWLEQEHGYKWSRVPAWSAANPNQWFAVKGKPYTPDRWPTNEVWALGWGDPNALILAIYAHWKEAQHVD